MDCNTIFLKDEVCGNINIPCTLGLVSVTIYDTDGTVFPSGSITIFYETGCAAMLQVNIFRTIGSPITFSILPGNTRSQFVSNIESIQIVCQGTGEINCIGKYCLALSPFPKKFAIF
jgi:hypothetical protein